jgi:hypothetical protein
MCIPNVRTLSHPHRGLLFALILCTLSLMRDAGAARRSPLAPRCVRAQLPAALPDGHRVAMGHGHRQWHGDARGSGHMVYGGHTRHSGVNSSLGRSV